MIADYDEEDETASKGGPAALVASKQGSSPSKHGGGGKHNLGTQTGAKRSFPLSASDTDVGEDEVGAQACPPAASKRFHEYTPSLQNAAANLTWSRLAHRPQPPSFAGQTTPLPEFDKEDTPHEQARMLFAALTTVTEFLGSPDTTLPLLQGSIENMGEERVYNFLSSQDGYLYLCDQWMEKKTEMLQEMVDGLLEFNKQ